MRWRRKSSISEPIILASVGVGLSIALIVGWIAVLLKSQEFTQQVAANRWLMVFGIFSLVVIISVLIWFGVFLVREILEGRRQTTFIDSVTHELKSPLASLRLCLETQRRPGISEDQRVQLEKMMQQDVDRLAVFIDDILLASRVSFEDRAYEFTRVKLGRLVDRVVRIARQRYELDHKALGASVEGDVALLSDPTALETVLTNLVDNAVKYSGDDRKVFVEVFSRDAWVVIEVRDNGIGIPAKHLRRIFNRFYRVPREDVRQRRGTGLGLFVASALVRTLGGRLTAQSRGVGQGTIMRVLLPRETQRQEAA